MSIVILLIFASLAVALLFIAGFVWAVRSGQYEDILTPSLRVLTEGESDPAGSRAVPVPAWHEETERQPPNLK